jgi:Mitochondrial carrier protein
MAHLYNIDISPLDLYLLALESEAQGIAHPTSRYAGGPALPALGHAVSGALGAAVSTLLTYPLAIVVTRLQVKQRRTATPAKNEKPAVSGESEKADEWYDASEKKPEEEEEYKSLADAFLKITKNGEDISALYSGIATEEAKTILDSFLFFLAYTFLRNSRLRLHGATAKRLPTHEELLVGMLAGAFGRAWTTPLSNVVTRKQTGNQAISSASATTILKKIYSERGITGFWSGYSATLVLTLNPALTFLLHETLLRIFVRRDKRANPGAKITFAIAAMSKAMASTVTYPFSLAKARAQVESATSIPDSDGRTKASKGVFTMIAHIVQTEGVPSLYQGLGPEVLKGFFSHGLTMLMKERIHKAVIRTYYLVLKALKKYPSPDQMAKGAVAAAGQGVKKVQDALTGRTIDPKQQEKLDQAMDAIHNLYENAKEGSMDIIDEYIPADDEDW